MATWIVGGVVLLAAAAAIWKIVRDRKKGACSCGGDCSRCSRCGH
ncbi:MAG TPA: FeoB-associated Cys-rich membrane protein [Candidatus Limiplasma pullicola]|nr:FeoB-associated Cys-rich membrane protein [Candidatus Limiplasma pullicola]